MNTIHFIDQLVSELLPILQSTDKQPLVRLVWTVGQCIVQAESAHGRPFSSDELKDLAAGLAQSKVSMMSARLKRAKTFFLTFPDWEARYLELSWTHYAQLLRLKTGPARKYYLQQAAANHWSTRELHRQIKARSFERLHPAVPDAAEKDTGASSIAQMIRDTYVLEFIQLPEKGRLLERELEQALLDQLQYFLLELGSGFAFVGRQKRIATETGKQFFIDLVFYHVHRKCYVLVDLKIGELSHRDIGQMDMYVRLYDDKYRSDADAPTVGIILCTEKDQSLVRYSMLQESRQLFASTYVLYLPEDIAPDWSSG